MSVGKAYKLDELLRQLPENSGLDPLLVEAAKTELKVLKVAAASNSQKPWPEQDVESLRQQLRQKDQELAYLRAQLKDRKMSVSRQTSRASTEIKEGYQRLFDHDWLAVYNFLKEHGWSEIEIVVTLQRILRASYSFCRDIATEQLENIEGEAIYPSATWMDDDGIISRTKQKHISQQISELAKLYQKTTAHDSLPSLQKAFLDSVLPTFMDPLQYNDNCVVQYAANCVDLSWSMCVQDPPLVFIEKIERGSAFNHQLFRPFTGSEGEKFDYLVWPPICQYHNGPILVKGIAQPVRATIAERIDKTYNNIPLYTGHDTRQPQDEGQDGNNKRALSVNREQLSDQRPLPKSPYFPSYAASAKTPRTGNPRPRTEGRYTAADDYRPGTLTVTWKNPKDQNGRQASAP